MSRSGATRGICHGRFDRLICAVRSNLKILFQDHQKRLDLETFHPDFFADPEGKVVDDIGQRILFYRPHFFTPVNLSRAFCFSKPGFRGSLKGMCLFSFKRA
jgi:hypothetical protein